ncbi:MAG: LCP family protein [Anaerolineales bacterium]
MSRYALIPIALALGLAGCLPSPKSERNAPRLDKLPTEIYKTPTPPPVISTPQPTALPAFDVGWPAPFTYGNAPAPPTPIPPPSAPLAIDPAIINIALLGSDRRPHWTGFNTDVIIIISVHPALGEVVMLSIPRDLYVYLPGYSMRRINTAFSIGERVNYPGGGPALFADTVRYNFGIPIHHYAKVEMDGFSRIVDTVGGVEVNVSCSYRDWRLRSPGLDPEREPNWHLYTVAPGVRHMDGDLALWYARSRKLSSDFDRGRRQQEVLRALYREILSLELITRIPELYSDLRDTVTTDLALTELLSLAPLATRIGTADVRSRFIGKDEATSWRIPSSGAQVLVPKPGPIAALVADAFDFEAFDELVPEVTLTVEVSNSSAQGHWGALAAVRLEYAGFATHVGLDSPSSGTPTHLIDYGLAQDGSAEEILQSFGLPASRLITEPDPTSPFAFRLVVGDDYDPCFDPTRDQLG